MSKELDSRKIIDAAQTLLSDFVTERGWTILDLRLVERGINPIFPATE